VDNRLSLTVASESGRCPRDYVVESLWNAGWTGRDREAVQHHIDELALIGVPAPSTTPIYFPLTNILATTSTQIQVIGAESSGEVEYALLFNGEGDIFVTVASDHTDRAYERHGIQPSKQLCPKILAPDVWPYAEVRQHWEQLVLRCWAIQQTKRTLYQQAVVGELLPPEHWLDTLARADIIQPGLVFLAGTPSTIAGWIFADAYELELEDPIRQRRIRHRYDVEVLGPGKQ